MAIFVQFLHPGGEPPVSILKDNLCPANNGQHHRKFLHAKTGSYVTPSGQRQDGCFTFWGEWEHESSILLPAYFPKGKGWPRQLHTALPPKPPANGIVANPCTTGCAQNSASGVLSTDPFVFCEPMLYLHCQITKNGQLNTLNPGDIVVFGSRLNGQFVVDTVFVIADRVSVNDSALCKLFVQANDAHFTTAPLVYRGATFAAPVDGMFSFFPALPCTAEGTPQAFQRPTLTLNATLINENMRQGHRISPTNTNKDVWQKIVDEIRQQGNVLGLRA